MIPYIIITITTVTISLGIKRPVLSSGRSYSGTEGWICRQKLMDMILLAGIFLLLAGMSVLRYKVGNDYTRYEEFFHLIPLKQVVPTEVGFNLSVLFLQKIFTGEAALPIFAVYGILTVLLMLVAIYEQSRDFKFSFFLFMTLSYYFQSLNTVRYYLAWAAALYSMRFVLKRQYLKFLILILVCATIHKSVILVIPVYILCTLPLRKSHYVLLTLCGVLTFILRSRVLALIIRFYSSYEGTQYLGGGTSLINILRIGAVFIVSLICYKGAIEGDAQYEFCFRLNFLALLLYVCGSFIPEISRVGYYLSAGHIFLIPGLVKYISSKGGGRAVYVVTCIAAIMYFAVFLYLARAPLVRIVPYHSWIFPGEPGLLK